MKISVQWIKDYVNIIIPVEKLAHKLTMAGLEVEKIEEVDGDYVLEMEITPNRPDCLNMIGVARELSAILNKPLKIPKVRKIKIPHEKCDIAILDKEGCRRYVGVVISGVSVGPSPDWLKKKIETIGLRSVNNIVDITNFCLMETGQPLHAFDYDQLIGKKIVVRRARPGEGIVTLDGIERKLKEEVLVIADAKSPVAIAGIMGGAGTEVTARTKNILLESAWFDPALIRRACRSLGLSSDSSYRFERGVDIQKVGEWASRAILLIRELAGGTISARQEIFVHGHRTPKRQISIRVDELNSFLGTDVTAARCKIMLKRLGFKVSTKGKSLTAVPPSFREDVKVGVDLYEEIARIIGFDNLPMSLPGIKVSEVPADERRMLKSQLRKIFVAQGFHEAVTCALLNQESLEKIKLGNLETVRIQNPLTQEQEMMRPHLLPSLLSVVRLNMCRGEKDIRLFEVGKRYFASGEEDLLALIMTGRRSLDWRIFKKDPVDFYDMKGAVTQMLGSLGVQDVRIENCDNEIFSPGQGVGVFCGQQSVGVMGKVDEAILKNWDIKEENLFFAQIEIDALSKNIRDEKVFLSMAAYPAVIRDVSLAVKKDITFAQAQELIYSLGEGLVTSVNFIEQYVGEKISADQRGLVFSLVYQSPSRTLTEEEVNKIHGRICQAFGEKLQAVIR